MLDLVRSGDLLFVGKKHPKYTNNKLRVFKSSVMLRMGLGSVLTALLWRYS